MQQKLAAEWLPLLRIREIRRSNRDLVYDAWMKTANIRIRLCKKMLVIPQCSANNAAKLELGRGSKKRDLTLNYWQRILRMKNHNVVKKL
jgi:hypothetical protein